MHVRILVIFFSCLCSCESFRIKAPKAPDRQHDLPRNDSAPPESSHRPLLPSQQKFTGDVAKVGQLMDRFNDFSRLIMEKQGSIMASTLTSEVIMLLEDADKVTSSLEASLVDSRLLGDLNASSGIQAVDELGQSAVLAPSQNPTAPCTADSGRRGRMMAVLTTIYRACNLLGPNGLLRSRIASIRARRQQLEAELKILEGNAKAAKQVANTKAKAVRAGDRRDAIGQFNADQQMALESAIGLMSAIDAWIDRRPDPNSCKISSNLIVDAETRQKIANTRSLILEYDVPIDYTEKSKRYIAPGITVYVHSLAGPTRGPQVLRTNPNGSPPSFRHAIDTKEMPDWWYYQDTYGKFVRVPKAHAGVPLPDPVVGDLHLYVGYPKLWMLHGQRMNPGPGIRFHAEGMHRNTPHTTQRLGPVTLTGPTPQDGATVGDLRELLRDALKRTGDSSELHLALPAVDGPNDGFVGIQPIGAWSSRGVVQRNQDGLLLTEVLQPA